MPKCLMLIGVPGSGKSTWITRFGTDSQHVVISTDNILEQIAQDTNKTYDEVFHHIKDAEKTMWQDFDRYSREQHETIIVDRTNLSIKSRKRFIDIVKARGYSIEAIVFTTPDSAEWNRRSANRPGKTIPSSILASMVTNYKIPTKDEGFDKITFIN